MFLKIFLFLHSNYSFIFYPYYIVIEIHIHSLYLFYVAVIIFLQKIDFLFCVSRLYLYLRIEHTRGDFTLSPTN